MERRGRVRNLLSASGEDVTEVRTRRLPTHRLCFAAGEDVRYNELVEADCPMTAIAMVKKQHDDWRTDVLFTISAVRIIFDRVVESGPVDARNYRDGTKFKFHGVRQCNYNMVERSCSFCETRR